MTKESVAPVPERESLKYSGRLAASGKKMSPVAGWAPAGAARGMATTFYCGSFAGGKTEKLFKGSVTFFPRPRGGWKTATRALVKELVTVHRAKLLDTPGAAFGISGRLEVTDVNFLFLLFAHIAFLSCVFGFGFCQSRRIVAVPLRPSRLGSGRPNGSAYPWNASVVELHAPQNLRPSSTNSQAAY
jgi:hypothetical protein